MNVRELLEILQQIDPELEVFTYDKGWGSHDEIVRENIKVKDVPVIDVNIPFRDREVIYKPGFVIGYPYES